MGNFFDMPDADKVNSMFARIANRYDLANRLLSLGIDQLWRARLVDEVDNRSPRSVLDLATGSGDVAFALREGLPPKTRITGMDFCQPMLDEAEIKKSKSGYDNLEFTWGDALDLPLDDDSYDAITIAFGFRNFADRAKGLQEMRRVLNPNRGYAYILEFSQPNPLYRPFYYYYLKQLLPSIAGIITGDRDAYQYLSDSIEAFPDREGISKELAAQGFTSTKAYPLALGSVALHIAKA